MARKMPASPAQRTTGPSFRLACRTGTESQHLRAELGVLPLSRPCDRFQRFIETNGLESVLPVFGEGRALLGAASTCGLPGPYTGLNQTQILLESTGKNSR